MRASAMYAAPMLRMRATFIPEFIAIT